MDPLGLNKLWTLKHGGLNHNILLLVYIRIIISLLVIYIDLNVHYPPSTFAFTTTATRTFLDHCLFWMLHTFHNSYHEPDPHIQPARCCNFAYR